MGLERLKPYLVGGILFFVCVGVYVLTWQIDQPLPWKIEITIATTVVGLILGVSGWQLRIALTLRNRLEQLQGSQSSVSVYSEGQKKAQNTLLKRLLKGVPKQVKYQFSKEFVALQQNQLRHFVQPIVTLPQKRVRFYEYRVRVDTEEDGWRVLSCRSLAPSLQAILLFRQLQWVYEMDRGVPYLIQGAFFVFQDPALLKQFLKVFPGMRGAQSGSIFDLSESQVRAVFPSFRQLGVRTLISNPTNLEGYLQGAYEACLFRLKFPEEEVSSSPSKKRAYTYLISMLSHSTQGVIISNVQREQQLYEVFSDVLPDFAQGGAFGSPISSQI